MLFFGEDHTLSDAVYYAQGTHQPAIWMGESGQVVVSPGLGTVKQLFEDRGLNIVYDGGERMEAVSANYYAVLTQASDADGGGVLYLDGAADADEVTRLVRESTDRLGVCNRLNLLLIDRPAWDRWLPVARAALDERGIVLSEPPHDHRLGHEWALDSGSEAHVTVAPVDGPVEAALTASRETSGLAATICTADADAATAFVDHYTGTGVFWNATSRLLDGYKLLGLPETGINVDHTPGPRGPVTYHDLGLRQFVVLPPAAPPAP